VPSVPAKSVVENLPRGLLLVEEYGALAVAIKSALRKFAPLHTVKVAASFSGGLELAIGIQPELFVLDLDPPPAGAIPFLIKLRADYPDSRILVLAAGTSVTLCAARGKSAAIHFIEKPFDLPEFGAAVHDLIGPWNGQSRSAPGTAGDLSFLDLAQVICLGMGSTALLAATSDGRIGEIHFRRGQIIHAAIGAKKGIHALEEIASWTDAHLSEAELPENLRRTIEGTWTDVLLPFAQRLGHPESRKTVKPPDSSPPIGQKILVVDDTDMLLIFVADVLSTFDPNLQITTAATGADGLRIAKELRPDLILLDYSLTDTTGDQICRQLLANEFTARIPVLMMSGHFSELMRTAEEYPNVVDALPKPFLSGALTSAVQRALANGPLSPVVSTPENSAPTPSASPVIPSVPPASPVPTGATTQSLPHPSPASPEPRRSPLPNGHEPNPEPPPASPPPTSSLGESIAAGIKSNFPVAREKAREASVSLPPTQKAGTAVATPPRPSRSRPEQPPPEPVPGGIAATFAGQTELSVTFSLEVAIVQLSPGFQVDAVRLRPVSRLVAVQMRGTNELRHAEFGVGFELGPFQLGANGKIETLPLTPIQESTQLPTMANSLRPGTLNLHPATSQPNLELAAGQNCSIPVQLTATFELVKVDLTPGFELKTIFVRPREEDVLLRNSGDSAGTRMELQEIETDPSGELRTFLVRMITGAS
jgi:DNA-binding response OmpR family regulator